jgi:hypothetical protein
VADLVHRLGDEVADRALAVGGDRCHLGDLVSASDLAGAPLDVFDDRGHGQVDAALQLHRVDAADHGLDALVGDRLGQDDGRRGPVAGELAGLGGDLAHHLRAHVLEPVGKLDLFGHGHAVLADSRRAKGAFHHDIAAFGAKRQLHGIGEKVGAAQHARTRVGTKSDLLRGHCRCLLFERHRCGSDPKPGDIALDQLCPNRG